MRDAISLINAPTPRTGTGRVARVNQNHRNTRSFGLVADKLPQLIKRPVAVLASLRATNRSLADTAQIFQSDSPASVLRFLNKLLADRVVGMLLESRLPSGEFLEFAFGRLGLFLLKIPPAMLKSTPVSLDIRPSEIFPVAVGGDIDNAQVHAQHALRINGLQRFNLTRGEQIELALDEAQVTFPASPAQQFELPLSSRKRDVLPAPNRPDTDFFALKL